MIIVIFSDIRDIHDFLEITVYDEDKEHFWKYEFLGKVILSSINLITSSEFFFL